MTDNNTNPRILLSVLWISIILNFFARDIHELGRPGMLEQMMSGTIDGVVVMVLPRFSSGLFRAMFAMKEIKNGTEGLFSSR